MGFGVAFRNLLLHILLFLLAQGSESRKIIVSEEHNLELMNAVPSSNNILRLPSSKNNNMGGEFEHDHNHDQQASTEHFHAHPTSHVDHMDPNVMVFFTLNDMNVGKTMPIYFPKKDPSTTASPRLLPKDEVSSIPFSSKELPYLLKFFSFSKDSPQGTAMEDTLTQCESKSIKGETKFCATSLESMLDFARGALGLGKDIRVVTTTFLNNSSTTFQNYTILDEPKEIWAPKLVACHTMPYPYAIFYCHYQESENRVFKILLGGQNGDKVEAVAVCHMDTSLWSRSHVSFRVLKIEPGTFPVCHFFPAENLVWVPTPTSN